MKFAHVSWLACGIVGWINSAHSFAPSAANLRRLDSVTRRSSSSGKDDNDEEEAWDANVDYDKEWPAENAPPDPSTAWDALPNMPEAPRLGIGLDLQPLNEDEAADIKKEAEGIINSAIDEGIQDIEKLRKKMTKEMESSRKIMQMASELEGKRRSEELMKKIDKMTGTFLDSTKETRSSTKTAAAASKAMEGTGKGLEMGTWGTLSGRTVVASGSGSLLGSIDNAAQREQKQVAGTRETANSDTPTTERVENRIIFLADTKQDSLAKQLVPALTRRFEGTDIPNCRIEVLTPTASMPLGGNNAACVLIFCTSLTQASSLSNILDKLLRKTLQSNGAIPTQLVGISTLGTERTDKFPYSVTNLLGKLDQRRQIEEVLVNTVQRRISEPPLDYTLIKVGDLKASSKEFDLRPGDVLDDATTVEAAAQAIVQAVAYQPFARNSTLSLSGALPSSIDETDETFWDTAFLCMEGPEVLRIEDVGDVGLYGKLLEYVQGWAEILADSGKGLTTPVRSFNGIQSRASHLVEKQDGVQLLFLPTKTGKFYMSKDEERQREDDSGKKAGTAGASPAFRKTVREGGIDVVVEISKDSKLRVRARRCNYADDAVVKELSEDTILKRLEDAMDVWKKELA